MIFLDNIPTASWQWLLIGIVFYTVGIKSFISYKKTTNQVALFYAYVATSAGVSYTLWSLPSIFSSNAEVIKYFSMVGDVLITIPIASHAILVWLLMLKSKRISKWALLIPSSIIALWSSTLSVADALSGTNFAHISNSGELLLGNLPSILSVLFIILFYPLAFYFFKGIRSSKNLSGKMRGVALGLIYAGLATTEIQANSFSSTSSQSEERTIIFVLMIVFGVLFFVITRIAKER